MKQGIIGFLIGVAVTITATYFGAPIKRVETVTVTNTVTSTISILSEAERCKEAGGTFLDTGSHDYKIQGFTVLYNDSYEISCELPAPQPLFDYKISE